VLLTALSSADVFLLALLALAGVRLLMLAALTSLARLTRLVVGHVAMLLLSGIGRLIHLVAFFRLLRHVNFSWSASAFSTRAAPADLY
jgi:hypothetical protein